MPNPMNSTMNTKKKALTSGNALNSAFEMRVRRFVMDMYLKILNHIFETMRIEQDLTKKTKCNIAYHERIDRVDHCVTFGVVACCKQLRCADEVGIGAHTAQQHHCLELKESGDKKEK